MMMVVLLLLLLLLLLVHMAQLCKAGPAVNAAGQVGQRRTPMVIAIRGGRVLPLRPRRILPGRAAGRAAGRRHPRHRQPGRLLGARPSPRLVLLGRLHEVAEQVLVGKVRVVNESLQVQRDLLGGQLGQLGVCLLCIAFLGHAAAANRGQQQVVMLVTKGRVVIATSDGCVGRCGNVGGGAAGEAAHLAGLQRRHANACRRQRRLRGADQLTGGSRKGRRRG